MNLQNLNWVDYLSIFIIMFSTIISVWRGAVKEILTLVSWVIAVFLAFNYAKAVGSHISVIQTIVLRDLLAGFLIFIGVLLIGGIINFFLTRMIRASGLGILDRSVGSLFGILRGGIILVIAVLIISASPLNNSQFWQSSILAPKIKIIAEQILKIMPSKWKEDLSNKASILN